VSNCSKTLFSFFPLIFPPQMSASLRYEHSPLGTNSLISISTGIYSHLPKPRILPSKTPGCESVKNTEFSENFIREIIIRVYCTDGSVFFSNSVHDKSLILSIAGIWLLRNILGPSTHFYLNTSRSKKRKREATAKQLRKQLFVARVSQIVGKTSSCHTTFTRALQELYKNLKRTSHKNIGMPKIDLHIVY
jgi:hypothetical protein